MLVVECLKSLISLSPFCLCCTCSTPQAKNASQDLQETMDRVEKVVYWYNCLQQYLKNSRKRLEILDPVATDVVEVAKQLKHCKVG